MVIAKRVHRIEERVQIPAERAGPVRITINRVRITVIRVMTVARVRITAAAVQIAAAKGAEGSSGRLRAATAKIASQ